MASELAVTIVIDPAGNGSGEYLVGLRDGTSALGQVRARIDRQALLEHEHAYSAYDYGMELYDALFTGQVGRKYQQLVGRAGPGAIMRLQLEISTFAPELHALPWERMFHVFSDQEVAIAASAQTPFSRFLITDADDLPPVEERPLRMLVAIANPTDLPARLAPIDVAAEAAALADLLKAQQGRVVPTLLPGRSSLPPALRERLEQEGWRVIDGVTSWSAIQRHLHGQHVLHILAHGQLKADEPGDEATTALLLEHEGNEQVARGAPERVLDQTISDGLAGVTPPPRLIFLAACESAKRPLGSANPFVGLGPKLARAGVPAVVAMQDLVPMQLAHELTGDFYRRLFEHGQVDRALNEARSLLFKRDQFEWAIPVLFLRLRGGRLFAERHLEPPQRVIFDGLIEEHSRLFAGREAILSELEQFMDDPAGGYRLIQAGAGLGKTALMANLVARHRETLAYHFFTPSLPESLQEGLFLRSILEQIGPWYGLSAPLTGQPEELRKYYDALLGQAPRERHTIVLDGLDEVTGWDLSRYLTRKLPPGLHFILTVRDTGGNPTLDFALPAEQVRPMWLHGLTREGVRAVFRAAGGGALRFAEDDELLDQVLRVTIYDKGSPELGADTLFVRLLAEDAAASKLDPARLARMPARMEAYLDRWWRTIRAEFGEEDDRKKRQKALVDLTGTLAAALGPIGAADLEALHASLRSEIERDYVETVVAAVRRIIVRDSRGDYTLLHPRLRDYLRKKLKVEQYEQKLLRYCAQWRRHRSRYALNYYAAHLADAAARAAQPERHALTETLVKLVTDRLFQELYLEVFQDLRGLQADVQRGLEAAALDESPEGLPLLVESGLALVRFRRERLRPEPLFAMAARGDIAGARRMLELFEMDSKWLQIALLTIAWLAGSAPSEEAKRQARALRSEVADAIASLPEDDQRKLLLSWIAADLDGAPRPQGHLELPPATDAEQVRPLLDVAAGVSTEATASYELLMSQEGVNWELLVHGASGDVDAMSEEIFLSHYLGPRLVALALADPAAGDKLLSDYLGVHTAYVYANYRFESLWALLRWILHHTEPGWVQARVRELLGSALGGSSTEFEEGLPLTVLALSAASGERAAAERLARLAAEIRHAANSLSPGRGQGDTWGRYKRLLAALAQAQAVLGADVGAPSEELLHEALMLHYGFAGYQAPACLAIAEAIRVCRPRAEENWIIWSLDSAQEAAHNIQEGTFCARMTARVNAMRSRWWSRPIVNLHDEIRALREQPHSERYASLHIVGHTYVGRGGPPQSFPLPDRVLRANTLAMLASAYQRGLPEFLRLNRAWQPDEPILDGTTVQVPDPGLAPLLATRLAAEALADASLSAAERAALIRSLVPVAAANPTTLDTLLARLLLAERPTDPAVLHRLAELATIPEATARAA